MINELIYVRCIRSVYVKGEEIDESHSFPINVVQPVGRIILITEISRLSLQQIRFYEIVTEGKCINNKQLIRTNILFVSN